ncbi:MAG TPA: polysaccharide deacetylase family protein [Bacillota bacterium]|nr:polysaccharide deacetylase family protein [Bacillota bacterium]
MSLGKWIAIFVAGICICSFFFAAFNALVDPFGLFGDRILNWWSYNMTQNPRTAKIGWLDKHHDEYDSYIIGCSKTSSFPVELLNRYYDAKFFNMIMYGGDMYDIEMTTKYILNRYGAKHIVAVTGFSELASYNNEADNMKGNLHARVDGSNLLLFYARYLFANPEYALAKLSAYRNSTYLVNADKVFEASTGAYDNSVRDSEPIGALDDYLAKYPFFKEKMPAYASLPDVDACVESVERIKDMCQEAGSTFTLIISPMFHLELDTFPKEDLSDFYRKLSQVTDFWDFSGYHSVAFEPRYFYDVYHPRNAVGAMALAKMFDDDTFYIPEDFGCYVTLENVEARLEEYFNVPPKPLDNEKKVPILMYHNLTESNAEDFCVTSETFEAQIKALRDAGYEAISFSDLIDFVERGTDLPEKPVIITFDDGYKDSARIGAPILEKYNMCGAINVIGVSVGKNTYKDTGEPITPHFSFEEVAPWVEKGVLEIQSHSFDMHNSKELDQDDYRKGVYQKPGESEEEYIAKFRADVEASRRAIEDALGTRVTVYAYPFGYYTQLSEVLLWEMGIKVTLTVEEGINVVIKGLPQSLRALKRCAIGEHMSPIELIDYLAGLTGSD